MRRSDIFQYFVKTPRVLYAKLLLVKRNTIFTAYLHLVYPETEAK